MAKFRGFIKNCEVCGKEFKVPPSQERVRTCSRECGYKIRKVANKVDWVVCKCKNCGKEFSAPPSQAVARVYCSVECQMTCPETIQRKSEAASGAKNPGWKGGISRKAVSKSGKVYRRSYKSTEDAKLQRRKEQIRLATPKWANRETMNEMRRMAKKLTRLTGIPHEIDHVIPLQNDLVCGLNCEANMRIVTAEENRVKRNSFEI